MHMTGEVRIPAPREEVWKALNDPDVLRQAIPGCQSLEKSGDNQFDGRVKAKVGPVSATFSGTVTLSDLNPPESYSISGEGKGGAAGFAKGGAKVTLSEDGEATLLSYEVNASVGGKLAQIGSRLVDGTAKKLSGEFFENFSRIVAGPSESEEAEMAEKAFEGAEEAAPLPSGHPYPEELSQKRGLSPVAWIAGLVVLVILLLIVFGQG